MSVLDENILTGKPIHSQIETSDSNPNLELEYINLTTNLAKKQKTLYSNLNELQNEYIKELLSTFESLKVKFSDKISHVMDEDTEIRLLFKDIQTRRTPDDKSDEFDLLEKNNSDLLIDGRRLSDLQKTVYQAHHQCKIFKLQSKLHLERRKKANVELSNNNTTLIDKPLDTLRNSDLKSNRKRRRISSGENRPEPNESLSPDTQVKCPIVLLNSVKNPHDNCECVTFQKDLIKMKCETPGCSTHTNLWKFVCASTKKTIKHNHLVKIHTSSCFQRYNRRKEKRK